MAFNGNMSRHARWALFCVVAVVALLAGSRANDVYRWGAAISGNELAMSHQDSIDAYLGTAIIDWDQLTAAAQEWADQDSLGGEPASAYSQLGADIAWAELTAAAQELADADSLGALAAADYATVSVLNGHVSDDTAIHGVGASTVASVLDISTHAALDTGVHGAGGSDLATLVDIATPTITDYTNAGHIHEGATSGGQLELTALSTAANENVDQDSLDLGGTQYDADTWFTTGEIDTTAVVDAQWNAKIQDYAGHNYRSKSLTLESPTNTEDFSVTFVDRAVTFKEFRAVVRGTSPDLTWTIRHGTDRSATGAEAITGGTQTTSTTGSSGTGYIETSFDDDTVIANSFIWLETTSLTGTVDEFMVTIFWDED